MQRQRQVSSAGCYVAVQPAHNDPTTKVAAAAAGLTSEDRDDVFRKKMKAAVSAQHRHTLRSTANDTAAAARRLQRVL